MSCNCWRPPPAESSSTIARKQQQAAPKINKLLFQANFLALVSVAEVAQRIRDIKLAHSFGKLFSLILPPNTPIGIAQRILVSCARASANGRANSDWRQPLVSSGQRVRVGSTIQQASLPSAFDYPGFFQVRQVKVTPNRDGKRHPF